MRRFSHRFLVLVPLLSAPLLLPIAAYSQEAAWNTSACIGDHGNTNNHSWFGHQERACEVRQTTIKLGAQHLAVKSENGGIEITGEDRSDVAVEARIEAWAGSRADAMEILSKVAVRTSGDSIRDSGPSFHLSSSGYAVNYHIRVPRQLGVDLKSMNGGIDIAHLEGQIHFETTNGGVGLNDLAGDVHGETVNGGLDIALTGDRWRGAGLKAETTNGGVSLEVPDHYSAHLEAQTVNGGIEVNFPVTIQGEIKNRLSTNLGSGGPTIHVETTNGGVQLDQAKGAR